MGLFTLEDTIAILLLQQMDSLIVRGADEKKFYTQAWWKSLFGAGNVESSMEEQYGLNYPENKKSCGTGFLPGLHSVPVFREGGRTGEMVSEKTSYLLPRN